MNGKTEGRKIGRCKDPQIKRGALYYGRIDERKDGRSEDKISKLKGGAEG